jgi:hypothetical protein
MRRAARIDANQPAIVSALRRAGVRVHITSGLGDGFPDLMCVRGEVLRLLEVKDGAKPPSARKLTPAEAEFHAVFPDHVAVVCSPEEALAAMGVLLG